MSAYNLCGHEKVGHLKLNFHNYGILRGVNNSDSVFGTLPEKLSINRSY